MDKRLFSVLLALSMLVCSCASNRAVLYRSGGFTLDALRADWQIDDFLEYMEGKYLSLDTQHNEVHAPYTLILYGRVGKEAMYRNDYSYIEWNFKGVKIDTFNHRGNLRIYSDEDERIRAIDFDVTFEPSQDSSDLVNIYFQFAEKLTDRFGPFGTWDYVPLRMEYYNKRLGIHYLHFEVRNINGFSIRPDGRVLLLPEERSIQRVIVK